MDWKDLYPIEKAPTMDEIRLYVGKSVSLWDELILHLETTYRVKQTLEYSKCSAQPGWNVKVKKSGKSLCTLYPMSNYFIALVVVGKKEENEVEFGIEQEAFSQEVIRCYKKTSPMAMGRWLMIMIETKQILNDVIRLIEIRAHTK